MDIKFEVLKGKTLTKVLNNNNEELIFLTDDGEVYKLYHEEDCSESVLIEDICGDLNDLIGNPLLVAEEIQNEQVRDEENDESFTFTWTFYKLDTIKGGVTIRWYGCSNGCYSESVSFCQLQHGIKNFISAIDHIEYDEIDDMSATPYRCTLYLYDGDRIQGNSYESMVDAYETAVVYGVLYFDDIQKALEARNKT